MINVDLQKEDPFSSLWVVRFQEKGVRGSSNDYEPLASHRSNRENTPNGTPQRLTRATIKQMDRSIEVEKRLPSKHTKLTFNNASMTTKPTQGQNVSLLTKS